MKSIPKKYFKAENLGEAIMNIRRCLSSGLTVEQMVKEITEQYSKTTNEDDKKALGKLLTAVYDFDDTNMARQCAYLFGLRPTKSPGSKRPLSYSILREHFYPRPIPWFKQYAGDIEYLAEEYICMDTNDYPMVVHPSERYNVIAMGYGMFCLLDSEMCVNLLAIENCEGGICIDEESFEEDCPPLYFTESAAFVSPVFKVRIMKKVLEYCLERIGFPRVEIKLNVLFPSPLSLLLNKEAFIEGGEHAKDWEGVNVYDFETFKNLGTYLFHSIQPNPSLLSKVDPTECSMMTNLLYSVAASANIFSIIFMQGKNMNPSRQRLSRLASSLNIFR